MITPADLKRAYTLHPSVPDDMLAVHIAAADLSVRTDVGVDGAGAVIAAAALSGAAADMVCEQWDQAVCQRACALVLPHLNLISGKQGRSAGLRSMQQSDGPDYLTPQQVAALVTTLNDSAARLVADIQSRLPGSRSGVSAPGLFMAAI